MTTISWRGGPILKSGAIGTEQACCCGCAPCCISGSRVAGTLYDTQAECEAAGGAWVPTADCSSLPSCSPACTCSSDMTDAPQICVGGVCIDVGISVTWCDMTVTLTDRSQSVAIDPAFDCGNGFTLSDKNIEILGVNCYATCNCVVVEVQVAVMANNNSTQRRYTARRSICGSSQTISDISVTFDTEPPGVCGDSWYVASGCDVAPSFTINFAP